MTALDVVDRRYLGGLFVTDATTGAPVRGVLRLSSPSARFFRNRSGVYVVLSALGLEAHEASFQTPPAAPAIESVIVDVTIDDGEGVYLPRLFQLRLPRDPDPSANDAVTQPVVVPLYRSLAAPLGANWTTLQAVLVHPGDVLVRNAVVRVLRAADSVLLGVGVLSAQRLPNGDLPRTVGQLLLPLVGIPAVMWSATAEGSVLISDVAVRLEIVAIPAALDVFDPDAFITAPGDSRGPFNVASGRRENVGILEVSVPS